jgi:ligand-binding sensor domain-containing protein
MLQSLRISLIILAIHLTGATTIIGQTLHFRNYSVDEGLPFVQVFSIYQDSKGYLWSGGYGGLSRFDGISFRNYSPRNGLPNHWVTSIEEDADGDLWVGTINGIAQLQNERFVSYGIKDGLPNNYVNCLLRDQTNNLWIGTEQGLCKHDGKKISTVNEQTLKQERIICLYQEENKPTVWIGTASGLWSYHKNVFTAYPFSTPGITSINSITSDKNGNILVGTEDGIYKMMNGRFTLLFTPDNVEMPVAKSMVTDHQGKTWIAADNGLYEYNGSEFRQVRVSRDINSNKLACLFIDYEKSLWLGTNSGLFRYRGDGFVSYSTHDGLRSNFIFGIARDDREVLWMCTENNGIYAFDKGTFTNYNRSSGLPSNKSNDCFAHPDGTLWVGTDKGLAIFNGSTFQRKTRRDGLHSDSINTIMRDSQGNMWLGGANGITKFSNNTFSTYYIPVTPGKHFDVWQLVEAGNGNIWVGTYTGGLFLFDGENFKRYDQLYQVENETFLGLCLDREGTLYMGTLDGLYIRKGNQTFHFTQTEGLNSDLIYTMTLDLREDYLWIGTNQGLSRLDVQEFRKSNIARFTTYGKEEGFSGVECNSNGTWLDPDGSIWFGTVNGIIHFNPNNYAFSSAYTKTNITGFRLAYSDTTLMNNCELPYDENNITFEYVGVCLTNPAKVMYKVMLEGFDNSWSPPTHERSARYSNLPSGKYTFKILSSNNEGIWNPEPVTFTFTIATPYWKRPLFWLVNSVATVVFLSLGIYWRINQIKRREKQESETRVEMAHNELKALRAQMNPHFVFNSLNSIQHYIITNNNADAGKYLNKFARLMRIILNNSEKSSITIKEELDYLTLYLELEAMRFEGKFTYAFHIDDDIDVDYHEIPAMLLQPYVENAILHGLTPKRDPGHLDIRISQSGNVIKVAIKDDGIGRTKSREMRQLSGKKNHKSLGMKITHDRLELINRLHGSSLSVSINDLLLPDGTPAGTQVDIFVPVS